jgi:uncharacterized protein (UPF0332 family)
MKRLQTVWPLQNRLLTEMIALIDTLFDTRNKSDYDDFFLISKEEVAEQHKSAVAFLAEVRTYLDKQVN